MKQLFKHGDLLYLINRVMPLHQFHDKTGVFNNEKMKAWKEWLNCDHVLKHNEMYLFVETIPEHEFEEIEEEMMEVPMAQYIEEKTLTEE
jgi:hypothetical protein